MNIAILTLNGHCNYGNRLQNYALQTFLQDMIAGCDVETVWHTEDNFGINKKMSIYGFDNIRRYLFNRHGYRDKFDSNLWMNSYIREYNIKNSVIDI